MSDLLEVCRGLLVNCLNVKEDEQLLIVSDDYKKNLGEYLYEAGKLLGAEAVHVTMKEREKSGQEPPIAIAEAMKNSDVVICVTTHSLTHTKARKNAVANGARLATMPGITEDMFLDGAVTADYTQVKELTEKVTKVLDTAKQIRIEKDGKALVFSVEGRNGVPSTGVYVNKGESGNLPSGEAYIAPIEGTAFGEIVIDGSVTGIGKIDTPITLKIEEGRIVNAVGEHADKLLAILGDGKGRCLAEFGIGTNNKARITGVILEDEKVFGTIHVAFGSNITFGGTIEAGVHCDLVVSKPDVYIDDQKVIYAGEHLF
ncbi:aminopeptidase [Litchfieldia alkalitelluris]|uniref:aminopeptidase n=1 Tax=Litchfieldia alkalitelluris TaxID=304268 RepID=UPI0009985C3A|nr:aminopeptidase [Litchfieldia alkalitelluris]